MIECKACEGSGIVDGHLNGNAVQCPICLGKKEITKEQAIIRARQLAIKTVDRGKGPGYVFELADWVIALLE